MEDRKRKREQIQKGQITQPLFKSEIGPAAIKIQHPYRLLITGRSTMGKTTLAVDIIVQRLMRGVRRCFAVCPTFWVQDTLAPLRAIEGAFPPQNVFTRVDDKVFQHIYNICAHNPAPTLIFVDDAAAESATNRGSKGSFARLSLACNHLDISMVGIFQRLTQASPAFRDNAEGVISFIPSKTHDVDTIQDEFNPCVASLHSKERVYKALDLAWNNARFCFIHREKFTGKVLYYAGFHNAIEFNKREEYLQQREQQKRRRLL
jgi:hypothetical protein